MFYVSRIFLGVEDRQTLSNIFTNLFALQSDGAQSPNFQVGQFMFANALEETIVQLRANDPGQQWLPRIVLRSDQPKTLQEVNQFLQPFRLTNGLGTFIFTDQDGNTQEVLVRLLFRNFILDFRFPRV
jgi:hypothetical protein